MITAARMNWGHWIADCPEPGCHDARLVTPGQSGMVCAAGHPSTVMWPSEATVVGITNALAKRPAEKDRNWFPGGHPLAAAHGAETDLTPAQLDQQTAARDQTTAEDRQRQAQLPAILESMGITVGPDGTFHGRIPQ